MCSHTTSDFEAYLGVFSQEAHGEEIWCRYKVEMDTLAGLRNRYRRDFMDLTVQRLEIEAGQFYLDLSWSQFPCTGADLSDFRCEWTVEMPGKVGANNATRVEGRAATWDMTTPDIPFHFQAESAVGDPDSTAGIVLVILLSGCCMVCLTAAAGAAVFFFLRGRKQAPVESGRAGNLTN